MTNSIKLFSAAVFIASSISVNATLLEVKYTGVVAESDHSSHVVGEAISGSLFIDTDAAPGLSPNLVYENGKGLGDNANFVTGGIVSISNMTSTDSVFISDGDYDINNLRDIYRISDGQKSSYYIDRSNYGSASNYTTVQAYSNNNFLTGAGLEQMFDLTSNDEIFMNGNFVNQSYKTENDISTTVTYSTAYFILSNLSVGIAKPVPEIDGAGAPIALALLAGIGLILRERRSKPAYS